MQLYIYQYCYFLWFLYINGILIKININDIEGQASEKAMKHDVRIRADETEEKKKLIMLKEYTIRGKMIGVHMFFK